MTFIGMMNESGMGPCDVCGEEKELNEDGVCPDCAKESENDSMGGPPEGMDQEDESM